MAPNSLLFSSRNEAIVIRGVYDVATDTSAETRKLEGKLDALLNLVTQLPANQKPASVVRVCGIRSNNDHDTSVCPSSQQFKVDEHLRLMLQTPKVDHHSSRDKALDRKGAPNSLQFSARNDAIVISGVQDVAINTFAKTRKLEGKPDALMNLVNQLAANQKPASIARVCDIRSSNDHHSSQFSARNDAIVIIGIHDVATDTSAETRKLDGKLDAVVNMVTQLAANQKPASVARQFRARNDAIVIRGVHDVATDISAKTRRLDGNLDALGNLVTQEAANQKPAYLARFCNIRSSNDHHTSFSARNDAIVIRGVNDVATDTSAVTKKLEGKLDALVNLVTQLAANQKPASVARVSGIHFSNDHHTSVCPSLQQFGVDEHPEAQKHLWQPTTKK
ncbi:hypothetical protein Fmac_032893 [Flemingia macrophylla]|uniref:Uncharacterized protein n=1 Tax=Flemingia macrophylla TaxID=520843 RepID=A0ABD1L690_9FABA